MLRSVASRGWTGVKNGGGGSVMAVSAVVNATPFSTTSAAGKATQRRPGNRKFVKRSAKVKQHPAWHLRQTEARQQIQELEKRIDQLDKKREADEAAKNLPELDDALLDELYAGVKEPEPIPPKEQRMLLADERKRLERYARVVTSLKTSLPGIVPPPPPQLASAGALMELDDGSGTEPTSFVDRMSERLGALTQRLTALQNLNQTQGQASTSATQQSLHELQSETDVLKQMLQTIRENEGDEQLSEEVQGDQEVDEGDGRPEESQEAQAVDEADVIGESDYKQFTTVDLTAGEGASSALHSSAVDSVSSDPQATAPTATATSETSSTPAISRLIHLIDTADKSDADRTAILAAVPRQEWSALGNACALHEDGALLAKTLHLLEGLAAEEIVSADSLVGFHTAVADAFANQGNVEDTRAVVERILDNKLPLTAFAQHSLVKAHVRQDPTNAHGGLTTAMSILDGLEKAGQPAAQTTYSLVVSALLDSSDMQTRDEAWGVWNRMRLNAYPVPDAVMWSNMLRACALGSTPSRHTGITFHEAHRGGAYTRPKQTIGEIRGKEVHSGETETALDLFKEMTIVEGVRPNPACYDHLILACCRGAKSGSYLEGFRLLSEMINTAQEAKLSAFEPTRTTYNALLEGCRGNKDLLRARWVLAEMIRGSAALWSSDDAAQALTWEQRAKLISRMPDAETLGKVFLTYAAWRPPKVRLVKTRDESLEDAGTKASTTPTSVSKRSAASAPPPSSAPSASAPAVSASPSRSLSQPEMDEAATSFSSAPPSTSAEVVREVRGLLARVVVDQSPSNPASPSPQMRGPMSGVEPSTRLLNAYLMVLQAHQPATQVLETFSSAVVHPQESLFAKMGLRPNAHTYARVLEVCLAHAKQRAPSRKLADWAWTQWQDMEARLLRGELHEAGIASISRRTVAEIWTARISYLAKCDQLSEAMATLREFAAIYPPTPKPAEVVSGLRRARKMPYFDFDAVKLDMQHRERDQVDRLRNVIKVLKASWQRSGFAARLLSSGGGDDDGRPHREVPALSDGDVGNKAGDTPTKAADAAGPLETSLFSSSRSSSPPASYRHVFYPRPPSLTFFDLNLLHQRLALSSITDRPTKHDDIKFISWACRVWESREKHRG